jgi:hypothetical protein
MAGILDVLMSAPALNSLSGGLDLAGAVSAGYDRIQFGQQQRQAADFAAGQMRTQAGQDQAATQRSAWSVDQSAKYIASDALAKAAASGGGASDPTVVNTIARIAAEGAYRSKLAVYGGDDRARLLNLQADAKQYEGALAEGQQDRAAVNGIVQGAAGLVRSVARGQQLRAPAAPRSLLGSYGSDSTILGRFGGGGPPGVNDSASLLPTGMGSWGTN